MLLCISQYSLNIPTSTYINIGTHKLCTAQVITMHAILLQSMAVHGAWCLWGRPAYVLKLIL